MLYEWDETKNAANKKKHGISFEEAITVFETPDYLLFEDEASETEQRFIAIGYSKAAHRLLVAHCYRVRDNEEKIRIISARKITKKEAKSLE